MMQQDTASVSTTPQTEVSQQAPAVRHGRAKTPREILSQLPGTATPWQQDSAIRANINFPKVDWSKRTNPLQTPTTKADPKPEFSLKKPMYHGKSMVQPDSIYRPEYAVFKQGVAGDPVPYNIANDNLITSILLGCFILAMISISKSGNFIQRQFRNLFHTPRKGTTIITETSSELRFQFFLLLQTCLLVSLMFFLYTNTLVGETSSVPQYMVIGIYAGIVSLYFVLKFILYTTVGWVFFDKEKNEQWMKSTLFLTSTEGIALFPIVMLLVYFGFSIENTLIYTALVIILAKILSFYKSFLIFFKKNNAIVQSFLYFCAFEMMPLGVLWGILVMTDNYIKVNY